MENKTVIAVVGGEEITTAHLDEYIASMPEEHRAMYENEQFRDRAKEQLLALYAYAQYGAEMNMEETEQYKTFMANARRDILARMAVNATVNDIKVTEEEKKEFYEQNSMHFTNSETVNAKHILVRTEEECLKVLEEVKAGKAFEEAAQQYSTCPSGSKGGDLGEFGKGNMVKEFEEAAFAAKIGDVVGPVATQFGYHLIKVEKHTEETKVPFEEVAERIEKAILNEKQNRTYVMKYNELKEKYVEVK